MRLLIGFWIVLIIAASQVAPSPRRSAAEAAVWCALSLLLYRWPPLRALVAHAERRTVVGLTALVALTAVAQTQEANGRYYPASALAMYGNPRAPSLQWHRLTAGYCDGRRAIVRLEDWYPTIGYHLGFNLTGVALVAANDTSSARRDAAAGTIHRVLLAMAQYKSAEPICQIVLELGQAPSSAAWNELPTALREVVRVDIPR